MDERLAEENCLNEMLGCHRKHPFAWYYLEPSFLQSRSRFTIACERLLPASAFRGKKKDTPSRPRFVSPACVYLSVRAPIWWIHPGFNRRHCGCRDGCG